ncbi:hypothetical protein [Paenibacillus thermotolerans]|uniref:hypothetical protein n=1 Tax=Paenibacillus thermotolerans TaxID=3027807 RepID=UPI002368E9C0|nr:MULTISPECIES: hypothetical protein [unclassified Paenibacillus]
MSRKWERMVQKNKEKINKQRQKQGKTPLAAEQETVVRGRSWFFPLVLTIMGIMFALTLAPTGGLTTFNAITVALYFVLAMFHFFLRRPYLKIGKSRLSWRTFTGEKALTASEIGTISFAPGSVLVQGKDGKTRRTFTKVMDLFPLDELKAALRQFAESNHVTLADNKRG